MAVAAAFAMGGVLDETTLPYEASAMPVDEKVGAVLDKWEKLALRLDPHTALQLRSVTDVVSGANYKAGVIDMLHDGPVMSAVDATCFFKVKRNYNMWWDGPLTREFCHGFRSPFGITTHAVQIVAYSLEGNNRLQVGDYFVLRNSWRGWAMDPGGAMAALFPCRLTPA